MSPARALRLAASIALISAANGSQAAALSYCDQPIEPTAEQQDTLFRFGGIVRKTLDESGHRVALMSRSGLDLSHFQVRYSHAGVSLAASPNGPWSVRQLYYACDEKKPRIFDQGISGFLLGTSDPSIGYISAVLLPESESAALERVALDNRASLQLLGANYSANAFAFAADYQNCNQWLAELLALAWAAPETTAASPLEPRRAAQRWLQDSGYMPTFFSLDSHALMAASSLVPWLHQDDHPTADIGEAIYRVSMPASIEAFVQASVPGASRIEFCHNQRHVVIHRGWDAIGDGCEARAGDVTIELQ